MCLCRMGLAFDDHAEKPSDAGVYSVRGAGGGEPEKDGGSPRGLARNATRQEVDDFGEASVSKSIRVDRSRVTFVVSSAFSLTGARRCPRPTRARIASRRP